MGAAAPSAGRVRFIAIDGRGASGKSTLAALIAGATDAGIIHTDDFASWDNPLDWYPELIARVLAPVSQGAETVTFTPTPWWSDRRPAVVTHPVKDIMIVEGVGALRREFRPYLAAGVFIDVPREVSIERGLQRDRATGVADGELLRLWNGWADEENRYFVQHEPRAFADAVLDGTRPFAEQIRF